MFGKLKEKLKNWAKGLTKKTEESEDEEEIIDVSEPEQKKTKKAKEKKKEKSSKKKQKKSEEFYEDEISKIEPEIEETESIAEIIEEKIKETQPGQDLGKILKGEIQIAIPDKFRKQKEVITFEDKKPSGGTETEIIKDPAEELEKEEEKKSFFSKFASKISKVKISEKEFWDYAEELETLLLENNVAFEVSDKIILELKKQIVGKEFLKKEIEFQITETLKDIIYKILIEPFDLIEKIKLFRGDTKNENKPYVILFCGINGTGKTTSIAKIANLLEKNKLSCVFAAGDTFRAASIEQLNKHGENLNIKTISHEYGSDPASVGYDAIKYAEKNNIDVVLIDTAGRMHTEKNLMAQIEKVAKVTQPNAKIFVGESITGNDIVEQVKAFNESVKIDGIILSKADIDEKGGTALSVGYTTGKPILFLGTGQNYDDLKKFDRNKFIESLGF
jgi:fused signal recognition particle receptor